MAIINLGNARLRQGNVEEAIRLYFKALKIRPESAEAYNGLGAAMVRKGMIEKAINHFKKALQLKPDFNDAKKNLKNTIEAFKKQKEGIVKKM